MTLEERKSKFDELTKLVASAAKLAQEISVDAIDCDTLKDFVTRIDIDGSFDAKPPYIQLYCPGDVEKTVSLVNFDKQCDRECKIYPYEYYTMVNGVKVLAIGKEKPKYEER